MTLETAGRSRERILLYGMEGVGKSDSILDVAAAIYPARMHIIDNDNAWDRMLEGPSASGATVKVCAEFRWSTDVPGKPGSWEYDGRWCVDEGNVVVYHASGWEANVSAIEEIRTDAAPEDWCGIDTGTALWSDVSDYFVDQVFDMSKADYFLKARIAMAKDAEGATLLEGWKDYGIINPIYNEGVMAFLITPPCNLIVLCEEEEVKSAPQRGKDMETKETRGLYGVIGYKPRGQKRIGHNMQTVIRLERKANGDYAARTVKDRGGREYWRGESVMDRGFSEWYLTEVGQWQESDTSSTQPTSPEQPKSSAPSTKVVPKVVAKS